MFSLKLDLLFADLKAVKSLARLLNREKPQASSLDPRELQRIRDELRLAREKASAQAIQHRYHLI
jgi:phage terminase Nu1 subunit (DNA packaging protein)